MDTDNDTIKQIIKDIEENKTDIPQVEAKKLTFMQKWKSRRLIKQGLKKAKELKKQEIDPTQRKQLEENIYSLTTDIDITDEEGKEITLQKLQTMPTEELIEIYELSLKTLEKII